MNKKETNKKELLNSIAFKELKEQGSYSIWILEQMKEILETISAVGQTTKDTVSQLKNECLLYAEKQLKLQKRITKLSQLNLPEGSVRAFDHTKKQLKLLESEYISNKKELVKFGKVLLNLIPAECRTINLEYNRTAEARTFTIQNNLLYVAGFVDWFEG